MIGNRSEWDECAVWNLLVRRAMKVLADMPNWQQDGRSLVFSSHGAITSSACRYIFLSVVQPFRVLCRSLDICSCSQSPSVVDLYTFLEGRIDVACFEWMWIVMAAHRFVQTLRWIPIPLWLRRVLVLSHGRLLDCFSSWCSLLLSPSGS